MCLCVFTIRAVSARGQVVASAGEGGAIRLTRREPNSLPGSPPAPPGCTSYPEPPSCSACSGRLVPRQSPGLKHSLTRTSPRLRRTRTPSCAPRSSGSSTCSWPPAPLMGVGARHGEKSPTRKGPTTPDHQAARPLVLDCVLCVRECNRPHVRANSPFTSPASPHPHGITS